MSCDIVLAGAAIIDIPVVPADPTVFSRTSTPAERILLTSGGDAMNEAVVAARLGKQVRLISRIGTDEAGTYLKAVCSAAGVETHFYEIAGLDTGVNVVLVDRAGERRFYTNPHGSLRALEASDITPEAVRGADIFCFASIFVFPKIQPDALAQIFSMARREGCIVCADTTLPKNGETIVELAPALRELDYFFANLSEAQAITGLHDPETIADELLGTGARHIILKLGAEGCLIADAAGMQHIAPCSARCVDTTGAGDNFAAGFLTALSEGQSFADCARFANACASVSVETVGATTGVHTVQQVWQRYRQNYGNI